MDTDCMADSNDMDTTPIAQRVILLICESRIVKNVPSPRDDSNGSPRFQSWVGNHAMNIASSQDASIFVCALCIT